MIVGPHQRLTDCSPESKNHDNYTVQRQSTMSTFYTIEQDILLKHRPNEPEFNLETKLLFELSKWNNENPKDMSHDEFD